MADVGADVLSGHARAPELRVRLVGRFEVSAGTPASPLRLPAGKATTVAELLAVRRRSAVSADAIVDVLWGDEAPAGAAQNLASLISRLRRVLGADRITGGHRGYRFETAGCWVDVDEAERLLGEAEGQLRAGRPALAAAAGAHARQLLERGAFLDGEPYAPWAEEGRRQVDRLVRRARRAVWTAALALGDYRTALEVATLVVATDPLDEEAHRAHMEALYRAGDAAASLAAYEQLRRTLVEELGADPSPETEALYVAVLRSEPLPPPLASAATDAPAAARGSAVSTLVGRDSEMAALLRHWGEAAQGRPRVVAVTGAAGSGKTLLVAELARRGRATGGAVLWARCHEAESSLFLQPLLEALRDFLVTIPPNRARGLADRWQGTVAELMPELRAVLAVESYQRASPELEHRRSLEAVARLLQRLSREQPVLLVLDNLHEAGQSTFEAVRFLLDRLTTEPVMIVGTVAPEATEDVRSALGSEVDVVALAPLSPAAVEDLARRFNAPAVDAMELYRRTGGHTQFVVEALRLSADGHAQALPESLRTAVLERVRRAGREVEELLRVGAVLGTTFELDAAAGVARQPIERTAERAERALAASLLTTSGDRFEFAGSVIRDVLYDTTPLPIRASRHRRAAVMLAEKPEAAALHHAAAGDWTAAHQAWASAAENAVRAFAHRDAERLLTEAVSAAERAPDNPAVARARLRRGQLREELADYSGARHDHTVALGLARQLGDDTLEAQALERLGWTAYYGRDSQAASELADQAAELAESAAAAPAALPSALVLVGRIRHWAGDIDGAAEAYEEALARDPDPATLASALSCLGALLEHSDRFTEARRILDRAASESTRTGAFRPLLRTLFFAGLARANLGDFGGALRALERKRRLLEEYDVHFYRARTDTVLAWVWREVGQLGRARDLADQAVAEAREVTSGSLQVEQELHGLLGAAECALLAGDETTAAGLIDESEPLLSAWLPFHWRAELRFLDVRCRLAPHRPEACEEAEVLLDLARQRRSPKYEALGLAHLGRHEEAATAAEATGSGLLVAEVAPLPAAMAAFDRLAAGLPTDLREGFVKEGRLARLLSTRQ